MSKSYFCCHLKEQVNCVPKLGKFGLHSNAEFVDETSTEQLLCPYTMPISNEDVVE